MICLPHILSAQNLYTVTGTMVDSLNRGNVMFATVGLLTPDSTAQMVGRSLSDAQGKFQISNIPAGEYRFVASLVGYEKLNISLEVGGESRFINMGDVPMRKTSTDLEEVKIVGEKPVYMIDGEKTLYNVSEDPAVQSGTAADALQNAPGVEVDVEGNVTLRGVSSVEIWINNKPSNMNAEALKQFLQQMPAGSIEKIEVITNPSARYSARGSGGIINIVTTSKIKKNSFLSFGVHGSSTPNIEPFLSYVYSNEKFSISMYANYSYGFNKGDNYTSQVQLNDDLDTASIIRSTYNFSSRMHNPGLFLHGSYMPDSMNAIYYWGGGYMWLSNGNTYSTFSRREYLYNPDFYEYMDSSTGPGMGGGVYAGVWYEHLFNNKGHKISAALNFGLWQSKSQGTTIRDYDAAHDALDHYRKESSLFRSYNTSASIDYTIPYHKNGEIELGIAGNYDPENLNFCRDTLVAGTTDVFYTDWLRYRDAICHSGGFDAYATIQHRFGNFTVKGGVRSEYEMYDLSYANSPEDHLNKHYWGLYPSLHLSYRTENMHNFKLSYSRRVNNPLADDLTTFVTYSDESLSMGNPNLRPAYTNSLEAGWTKFINKFGNVGLNAYFRNTKDEFSNVEDVMYDPVFGRIVSFTKPLNAGKSLNTGAELNVTYQLKSFMNMRFYANMYYMKSSFQFRDIEVPYTVDNIGYSFRFNFWAKMWKVLEVNASANYSSKSVDMFTTTRPRYSIDAGLRAEFWKRRISVHVDVTDIFNWNKTTRVNDNPYFYSTSTSRNSWMGRSIRAGITFKFGKMELEGAQAQAQGGQGGQGMGM